MQDSLDKASVSECFCFTPVNSTFCKGMHDLKVWANVEADGSTDSRTPGKAVSFDDEMSHIAKVKGHS